MSRSCASAVAAMLNGKCDREVTVLLTGGKLNIAWEGSDAPVYMTGPAVKVFEGEIELPEEGEFTRLMKIIRSCQEVTCLVALQKKYRHLPRQTPTGK